MTIGARITVIPGISGISGISEISGITKTYIELNESNLRYGIFTSAYAYTKPHVHEIILNSC